ncbi:MAG: hypothetical protein U9O96_04830 [Candidatus Thermoplasmatota archaeon]|nr:hypothetical protein [Candidatus Thermoplasmatota archaeon]
MKWKTLLTGFVFVVLISSVVSMGGANSAEEKPVLSSEEVKDFMVVVGADRKAISERDISPVYRSDISDDFLQWVNMSVDEGANFVKNMVQQTIEGGSEALKDCLKQLPPPGKPSRPKLTFGPETLDGEREKPSTIAVYGEIPAFETQEERWEWTDKLHRTNDRVDEMHRAGAMPDAVCTYGIGAGYHVVGIDKDRTVKDTLLKEVYELFKRAACQEGMDNPPVVFEKVCNTSLIEDTRDKQYRPIRGGIQCQNPDPYGYIHTSTIGYSAIRNGAKGYVVSGHLCHYNQPTPIGWPMYQPTFKYENLAGYVMDASGQNVYSDSAFVEYNNVVGYIYLYSSGSLGLVWGKFDPSVGHHVYMSGITSGLVDGSVAYTDRTIWSDTHHWLYDQVYASYQGQSGDSGAPVFYKYRQLLPSLWLVDVNGIHAGHGGGHAVFSPQSGVNRDLGATPVTAW